MHKAPGPALRTPYGPGAPTYNDHEEAGMPERTDQPSDQPSLTPQPNRILAEPATVDTCRADYNAGADVRQTLAAQEARGRA